MSDFLSQVNRSKVSRFSLGYIAATGIYYLFDFIYMPWLTLRYGYKVFIPLYPSILIANLIGLYFYDLLREDLFFIELGKNWLNTDAGRIKKSIRKSKALTFLILSIWPSPIAGYLYLRRSREPFIKVFKTMALGSIFCTAFWGGGLSLVYFIAAFAHFLH